MQVTETRREDEVSPEMALVDAAKQGDTDAFAQLVFRYQASVFRIAQHITRSREDAEEVTQESFLKALPISGSSRKVRGSRPG